MLQISIQVREAGKDWEQTPKIMHTFKTWSEVSTFAYRLALQHSKEVRAENKGNGHYYSPSNANNFLNS